MEFFDLGTIIFLVAAVVIFIQLRNVLGRRTGNERPPFDPYTAGRQRPQQEVPDRRQEMGMLMAVDEMQRQVEGSVARDLRGDLLAEPRQAAGVPGEGGEQAPVAHRQEAVAVEQECQSIG